MDASDYSRLKELLLQARELAEAERDALLSKLDETDPAIATELRSLLAHERTHAQLRTAGPLAEAAESIPPALPERIGNYEIVEVLGEGGMGIVLHARQTAPIERDVAIKLIRSAFPSGALRERFLNERQTLAQLDHPNIASVYDAGTDEYGRPYLVMERVQGDDVLRYAAEHGLGIHARIELMLQICAAVQHAHQRGILHRDLKAGNVLITEVDGLPVAKVIDFGIARAIEQDDLGLTRGDQTIGTPNSMSPEQAGVISAPVDTRSDVYALGILLCQLLAGEAPYHFETGSLAEWQALLEGDGPRRPSELAPGADARALRGDLDAIVLKALRRLPADRFASVDRLAEDLQRHLDGLPVFARAGNWRYHAGKFLRRHRASVAVATLLAVGLLGFLSALAAQSQRLARERDRALAAEQRAAQEAESARRVSDFMVDLFEVADPNEARGNSVTAREILDRGVERIHNELREEPTIRAGLLAAMGRVYHALGLFAQAESLLTESVGLAEGSTELTPIERSMGLLDLGSVYQELGRYALADSVILAGIAMQREVLPSLDPRLVDAQSRRMELFLEMGNIDSAAVWVDRLLDLNLAIRDSTHVMLGLLHNDRGSIQIARGQIREAIASYRRSLLVHRANYPGDHPETATNLANLGNVYARLGELDSAVVYDRRGMEMRERLLGKEHVHTIISLNNLATHLHAMDRYEEARPLFERALEVKTRISGPRHRSTAVAMLGLGRLLSDLGEFERAERLLHTALDIHLETIGESHIGSGVSMAQLSAHYEARGDRSRALHWAREALRVRSANLDAEHPYAVRSRESLARLEADSLAARR